MIGTTFSTIRVNHADGVAQVTIDNPPINVLDIALMQDLRQLLDEMRDDDSTRVIVFDSANPNFFIAHVDMTIGEHLEELGALMADLPEGINVFQGLGEKLRSLPQVTIVRLAGIARGGGAEFVAAADMAFAAVGHGALGQIEALMGIVPGGGGTQYLTHRVGRNRAFEVVLGAGLYDAETAERYGWINRALPPGELGPFVDRLAHNIAALSPDVVSAAKSAISLPDFTVGLGREHVAWENLVMKPEAAALIEAGLRAGAQTPQGEQDLEGLFRTIKQPTT